MADQQSGGQAGGRSPTSGEAKEQGMSGNRGPQASQEAGAGRQPEQGSNRTTPQGQEQGGQQEHFAPGHAPSEQGEKDHPSPHVIAQHQQGIGRQSGSHAGQQGDRSEERATSGEPQGDHTRHGRETTPGSRANRSDSE